MNSQWQKRAAQKLGAPTDKVDNLPQSTKNWVHTGQFVDHGKADAVCELCGNTGLRYHFLIAHRETGEALWVGSQCVMLFGVAARHLQHKLRQAHQPQARPLDEARILALISPLQELHAAVGARDQCRIRWIVGKFDHRAVFSPADLAWLFQAMLLCGIRYEAQQYSLTLKTKKDRNEMNSLPLTAARLLADCLTPEQFRLCQQWGIRF